MKIDKIYLNQSFQSQEEVFSFLDSVMLEIGIIENKGTYLEALHERESQSTTGLVDGFAIPHGKSNNIKDAAVIYIRNQEGIEWNSLDGSAITDIFALAIPLQAQGNHLDTLIAISTQLMDPSICQRLRNASLEEEINEIFA